MSFFKKILKWLSLYFKYRLGRFDYNNPFLKFKYISPPPLGYTTLLKNYPQSIFCKKQHQAINENIDVFAAAKKVIKKTNKLFTYKKEKIEKWQSHYNNMICYTKFKDDCDGFALTCAEQLYWLGVNRNKINIVFCQIEDGTNHLVCVVDNILIDNRFQFILPWDQVNYKWIKSMNLEYPGHWMTI